MSSCLKVRDILCSCGTAGCHSTWPNEKDEPRICEVGHKRCPAHLGTLFPGHPDTLWARPLLTLPPIGCCLHQCSRGGKRQGGSSWWSMLPPQDIQGFQEFSQMSRVHVAQYSLCFEVKKHRAHTWPWNESSGFHFLMKIFSNTLDSNQFLNCLWQFKMSFSILPLF